MRNSAYSFNLAPRSTSALLSQRPLPNPLLRVRLLIAIIMQYCFLLSSYCTPASIRAVCVPKGSGSTKILPAKALARFASNSQTCMPFSGIDRASATAAGRNAPPTVARVSRSSLQACGGKRGALFTQQSCDEEGWPPTHPAPLTLRSGSTTELTPSSYHFLL